MTDFLFLLALYADRLAIAGSEKVAHTGIVLMQEHGTKVKLHEGNNNHHQQGEQGIEVEGNGLDEDADAVFSLD